MTAVLAAVGAVDRRHAIEPRAVQPSQSFSVEVTLWLVPVPQQPGHSIKALLSTASGALIHRLIGKRETRGSDT